MESKHNRKRIKLGNVIVIVVVRSKFIQNRGHQSCSLASKEPFLRK